jgi:uncharacterized repeat protein (TIGR03806 family)
MYFPVFFAPARRLRRVGACAIGVLQSARCRRQRGRGDLKKATGLAAAGWILAAAVVLGLTGAARGAAATLTDIGAASPTPGTYDICQLNGTSSNDPAGLNYFDNNGSPPGQTFTTGSSPGGYILNSVALKTSGNGSTSTSPGSSTTYALYIYTVTNVSAGNATLITTYTATATFTQNDWLQWTNLGLALNANALYAFAHARTGDPGSAWERISVTNGNPYAGGQIALIPAAGGAMNFGNSSAFDMTFDLGLTLAPPAAVWSGAASGNWDKATANWILTPPGTAGDYADGDSVGFGDTGVSQFSVNLASTVAPSSVTFSNSAHNYTVGGTGEIGGSGSLALTGAGAVTLNISNAFAGAVTVGAGATLNLNGTNTYAGTTTIGTGATLAIGGAGDLGNGTYAGAISDNGTLNFNSTTAQTLTGAISGTGGVTVSGGTLTLGNDSLADEAYTGATVVGNGTLILNFPNAGTSGIYKSSGLTINNGGTVSLMGSSALEGYTAATPYLPVTINAGGTLTTPATGFGCHLYGVLNLNGGALAMSGSPNTTYAGWEIGNQVNVNGGAATSTMSAQQMGPQQTGGTVFNITSGGTSQTIPGVDVNVTGTFTNSSGAADTGIILTGTGVMALAGGSNDIAHGITIGGGATLLLTNAATVYGPVLITNNGAFIDGSTAAQTLSGVISGTGVVEVTASGTALTLNAADTYSGNTIINAGTLFLGVAGSISNTPSISVAGGATLDVSALAAFALGGSQSLLGSGTNNGSFITTAGSRVYAGTAGGYGTNIFTGNLTFVSGAACYLGLGPTYNSANGEIILNGASSVLTCGGATIFINCGATLDQTHDYTLLNVTGASGVTSGAFNAVPVWQGTTPANSGYYTIVTLPNKVVLHYNATAVLPAVTNLAAASLGYDYATLNGQLISEGNPIPSVQIYYGTSDGAAKPAAWATNVSLGLQTGYFSAAVSNLLPSTVYYYAVSATNAAGTAWGQPSESFTTLALTAAVVTNLPASSVAPGSAVLNGEVIQTGTQTPEITLFYGTNDGGTDAGAWSNVVVLGLQSGSFSYSAGGLSNNTTYYYAFSATNSAGVAWATPSETFMTPTPQPVLTYHFDNTRQGANTNETILTPANVNTNSFGKLFTYTVDGYVYAQPLIAINVTLPGNGTHNLLFVATENDTIYAFDADNYVPTPYWTNNFLNSADGVVTVPSGVTQGNVVPQVGITATPVIDPATGTIYAEVMTQETVGTTTNYVHRLHALDIASGLERTSYNSPVVIAANNYPGTGYEGTNNNNGYVIWNPVKELSRPALLLANGMVYLCYSSFGDHPPYYGWVFSYDAHTLAQTAVFNTSPNSGWGGIWMTGNGPAADSNGNIYLNTGNGPFDANTGGADYGDSIIKLNGTNGLALEDYFTPYYQAMLDSQDLDISSAGVLLLPPAGGTNLLLSGSKYGPIYLLNATNMGKYNTASDSQITQEMTNAVKGQWSSAACFNGNLYFVGCNVYGGGSDVIKQFAITNGMINTNPVAQGSYAYNYPGATPAVSASGTNNGIVWTVESAAWSSSGPAVLHAYNATNVAQELYNSSQLLSRDNPGVAVLFTLPAVANGKVYVGARFAVSVFGLNTFVSPPVISPGGGAYANAITVTLSDVTPGVAAIYYTLDGTVPGTNSLLYTGPFVITNTLIVQSVAVKPGAVNSGVSYASFVNTAAPGQGLGLLGQYWTNTTASAFTNLSFDTLATLTRTDAVVNFDWGTGGPAPSIGSTNFTARWTGAVQAQYNESYTFTTIANDGVRLWVNGQLLVNDWTVHASPATNSGVIALNSQQLYNIRMDYFQNTGSAAAQLLWSSPSTMQAVVPQTQLYPYSNPPPSVILTAPAGGSAFTAAASVSLAADADALYNALSFVSFYTNGAFIGTVSNAPYSLTATGLPAGSYTLTATATDGSGLAATSAPVAITITAASGLPYGLTTNATLTPFLNQNMPGSYAGSIPWMLSQTGAFANTPNRIPAAGLIPYTPNTPLWSDNALKSRYLAVPNSGLPITPEQQMGFAPTGRWTFPSGTVFVKNFDLVVDETNPNTPVRRLETRLLVRDTNGAVYGVTYKWLPDNSDAQLLTGSLTEAILVTNATGVVTQNWYYPSPADCLTCHTAVAGYVLGVNTRQLNGTNTYPATGVADNQLRTLNRLGMFYPAFDEAAISGFEQLSSVTNPNAPLVQRARSYLDANCSQCHQPGGTGITFDARYDTPLASQNISNYPAVFALGVDNARIISPNDVWRSMIYARMNTENPAVKMPNLARNLIDSNAVQPFVAWINSMGATPALAPPLLAPASGIFTNFVTLAMQPPDANAVLYYTLDGSLPTTASPLYTGPFTVTSSATVTANAFEAGYVNSVAAAGLFTIVPPLNNFFAPGFLPNGTFEMQFWAAAGQTFVLQSSSNLINWTSFNTNTPASVPFTLVDPGAAGAPMRFYRIVPQSSP